MRSISRFTKPEVDQLMTTAQRVVSTKGLTILLAPKTAAIGRILVITPRHCGNSPQRNLIRRRLKAIFYEEKFFEKGYDCVVLVRKSGIKCSFEELKSFVNQGFARMLEKNVNTNS